MLVAVALQYIGVLLVLGGAYLVWGAGGVVVVLGLVAFAIGATLEHRGRG